MTPRERFFNALTLKEVDRVPASFVTQPVIVDYMKLTGSKWPEAHYDAEMMAELSFASHELGGVESLRASASSNPFKTSGEISSPPSFSNFPEMPV